LKQKKGSAGWFCAFFPLSRLFIEFQTLPIAQRTKKPSENYLKFLFQPIVCLSMLKLMFSFLPSNVVCYPRWIIPPAAIAMHMSIGSVYSWSVFNEPLTRALGSNLQKLPSCLFHFPALKLVPVLDQFF
jgi:hypothetical protein